MRKEWRFTEEQSHAFFTAFWENAQNPKLKSFLSFRDNLSMWLETLRSAAKLVIAPTGHDNELFLFLVEQELLRLARLEAEDVLGCGCQVFRHRQAVQQFRLKNLSP